MVNKKTDKKVTVNNEFQPSILLGNSYAPQVESHAKTLVNKVVSTKARDMIREGRDIITDSPKVQLMESWLSNNFSYLLAEYLEVALIKGVKAFLLVTNSFSSLTDPLNYSSETLLKIVPVDEVEPIGDANTDIMNDNWGGYEYYELNGVQNVHYSRLVFLKADNSDIETLLHAFSEYLTLLANIKSTQNKNNYIVLKVDGYKGKVSNPQFKEHYQRITNQLSQNDGRGTQAIAIDSRDDLITIATNLNGYDSIIKSAKDYILLVSGLPEIFLFGSGLGGLSSGEEYANKYLDTIRSLQNRVLRPFYNQLDSKVYKLLFSGEDLPNDYYYNFNPLETVNELEQSTIKLNTANFYNTLYQMDAVNSLSVAKDMHDLGYTRFNEDHINLLKGVINRQDRETPQEVDNTAQNEE